MKNGGGVFYQEEIEASLNKNPTPWGFSRHSPVCVFPEKKILYANSKP